MAVATGVKFAILISSHLALCSPTPKTNIYKVNKYRRMNGWMGRWMDG
jgi:hypothetical protein